MEDRKIKKSIRIKDRFDLGYFMYSNRDEVVKYKAKIEPMLNEIAEYWKELAENWSKDPYLSDEDIQEKKDIYEYLRKFKF